MIAFLAQRDLTALQFRQALARHGFAPLIGGLWYRDTTGRTDARFEAIYRRKPFGLNRRATLARLIQAREAEIIRARNNAA